MILYLSFFLGRWIVPQVLEKISLEEVCLLRLLLLLFQELWLPLSKKLSLFEPVTDRRLPEEQIESKAKQDNSTFHLQCVVSPTAVFLLMITVITWSEGRRTWIESKERRRTFDKWIWIEDDCSFSSKASLYLYKKRLQIQLWFHIWSWESTVNERDEKAPLMSSLLFPVSSNR